MSNKQNNSNIYRIAIIGSGPAGFFAADHLFKNSDLNIEIDMYDKLPTPFGLVRTGVAPDHQKIKTVTKVYDKIAANPKFRFFGLIEFGKHITLDDLKMHYHQVLFATGAQTDRRMNIPGEDLKRSHTATEFVAWYNGHPEFTNHEFDLSVEKVAIIGIGNVAVDVARILCRSEDELSNTDITDYAFEKLKSSNVKEVYMIGRRGPAQAAFTNPEIKELGNLEIADAVTLKEEVELDELTSSYLTNNQDRSAETKIQRLKEYSNNTKTKNKCLTIRFLLSPVELLSDDNGNVKALKLVKNRLFKSDDGSLRPKASDEYEILNVDMVFRSIGYYGIPLPGIPFNENWGVIPNENGRITDIEENNTLTGLYVTGWIKRGPSGVIGTNKTDSAETVSLMVEDIQNNNTFHPDSPSAEKIESLIKERNPEYIDYEDWLKIDKEETERGEKEGKPRVKFTKVEDIKEHLNKK
ncbi:MAG: FAD-dependent oxidoreductase [Thermodesulfobacteriota bacterium]